MGEIDWHIQNCGEFPDEGPEDNESFNGTLIIERDKAILFETSRGRFWCPKSLCDYDDESIEFPSWFVPKFLPKEPNHDDAFGEVK